MTPSPKSGGSGKRDKKLEQYRKELSRKKSNRRAGIIGAVAGVLVVGGLIAFIVVNAPPQVSYDAGGTGAEIDGVETFENEPLHVETPVTYPQTPPAGGEHSATWLNCGVYSEPVPNENAVHALEHGAVWATYDPAQIEGDEVDTLRALLPDTHSILSPYEGMDTPIALSGWNVQLKVDSVDDERITEFFEEYWLSQNVPEPGAACTGAIDGPGKVN
ncbi:DUF3105 domain-containing protein [Demequina sp. SO4-13]|uniref:DUF3105 domain-containing protein n=1 Tax=Demequina sp. SO4-13 TaxID=3401027 RepID=UPI003AF58986